jgi:Fur family ferric uptake transcriptional regulator
MPTITICTFLTLTNGFKLFDQNFALTGGNPAKMSQLLALNIYDTMYGTTGWQGASPNPTTVYRYLDKLAGEQRIMKYVADKGEKAVFQYVDEGRHCREHLHLKCVQCGRIYHLDCHFMDEVRAHLMAEHGFTLQCEGSVLYGLCRHCAQKEEQSDSDGQTAQKCACCVDTDKKP